MKPSQIGIRCSDQKVAPEAHNQPLLPREIFSHSSFPNSFLIQQGNMRLCASKVRHTYDIALKLGWYVLRFVRSELHLDTHLEICSPSIGTCNYVCTKACNKVCTSECGNVCHSLIPAKPHPNLPIKLQLGLIGVRSFALAYTISCHL